MELHAWIVCIPIGTQQRQKGYGASSIIKRHSQLVKTAKGGEMFMIPGRPETADYIASICREITERYDIDGISLDYIRYPESVYNFSDTNLYNRSCGMSLADWRRDNITRIVRRVHDVVKPIKPWVKLSSSPIGKYSDTGRYSAGGWNCYHAVWQDPKLWLSQNYQDMIFPMMYFTGDNFYPFLYDWQETCAPHPVIPGLGIYFLDPREGRWALNDVRAEMHTARNSNIGGMAFYRGEFLTRNVKGLYDAVCEEFFPYPALTARMTWTGDTIAPNPPSFIDYKDGTLSWGESYRPYTSNPSSTHPDDYILYNVYGSNNYPVDVTRPENLLMTNLRSTFSTLDFRAIRLRYYAVTAIDRMGNESQPIQQDPPTVTVPRTIDIKKLINSGTGTKTGMKKETKSKKRGKEDRKNRKRK